MIGVWRLIVDTPRPMGILHANTVEEPQMEAILHDLCRDFGIRSLHSDGVAGLLSLVTNGDGSIVPRDVFENAYEKGDGNMQLALYHFNRLLYRLMPGWNIVEQRDGYLLEQVRKTESPAPRPALDDIAAAIGHDRHFFQKPDSVRLLRHLLRQAVTDVSLVTLEELARANEVPLSIVKTRLTDFDFFMHYSGWHLERPRGEGAVRIVTAKELRERRMMVLERIAASSDGFRAGLARLFLQSPEMQQYIPAKDKNTALLNSLDGDERGSLEDILLESGRNEIRKSSRDFLYALAEKFGTDERVSVEILEANMKIDHAHSLARQYFPKEEFELKFDAEHFFDARLLPNVSAKPGKRTPDDVRAILETHLCESPWNRIIYWAGGAAFLLLLQQAHRDDTFVPREELLALGHIHPSDDRDLISELNRILLHSPWSLQVKQGKGLRLLPPQDWRERHPGRRIVIDRVKPKKTKIIRVPRDSDHAVVSESEAILLQIPAMEKPGGKDDGEKIVSVPVQPETETLEEGGVVDAIPVTPPAPKPVTPDPFGGDPQGYFHKYYGQEKDMTPKKLRETDEALYWRLRTEGLLRLVFAQGDRGRRMQEALSIGEFRALILTWAARAEFRFFGNGRQPMLYREYRHGLHLAGAKAVVDGKDPKREVMRLMRYFLHLRTREEDGQRIEKDVSGHKDIRVPKAQADGRDIVDNKEIIAIVNDDGVDQPVTVFHDYGALPDVMEHSQPVDTFDTAHPYTFQVFLRHSLGTVFRTVDEPGMDYTQLIAELDSEDDEAGDDEPDEDDD